MAASLLTVIQCTRTTCWHSRQVRFTHYGLICTKAGLTGSKYCNTLSM